MVWLVVHGIFWALLVRFFGKMADFINFETDDVDGDAVINKCDPVGQTVSQFIDDETQIDENIEDYCAFTFVWIIRLDKINLTVMLKIARVIWASFIILTSKVFWLLRKT